MHYARCYPLLLCMCCLAVLPACSQRTQPENPVLDLRNDSSLSFPYDLLNPTIKQFLPAVLTEVSGIAWVGDSTLLMIQDEVGHIFRYDLRKRALAGDWRFGNYGDYEDVALVGDTIFVLRSDGTLFEVTGYDQPEPALRMFETALSSKNDTEGLFYDASGKRLLIACKASPVIGEKSKKRERAIYAFDLPSRILQEAPVLMISLDSLDKQLREDALTRASKAMVERFSDGISFQPSALAVHPIDGNLYLISSAGKTLLVLDPDYKPIWLCRLKKSLFTQPEGLCFSPDGTMYISNEGAEGNPSLLVFPMKKP